MVQRRSNVTTDTPKKGERLLDKLREGFSITAACAAQRISRKTYYRWLESDPEFALAVADAIEAGTDKLEDVVINRAVAGSDTLAIFLLKARRPEKYRERATVETTVTHKGTIQHNHRDLSVFTDDELDQLQRLAAKREAGMVVS